MGGSSGARAWNAAQLAPMEVILTSRRMAARFMVIHLPLYCLWQVQQRARRDADERLGLVRAPDGESAAARDSAVRGEARFLPPRVCRRFLSGARGPFPAFGRPADKAGLRSIDAAGPGHWPQPMRSVLARRAITLPQRMLVLAFPGPRLPFPYRQSSQFLLRCFRHAKFVAATVGAAMTRWPTARSRLNGCSPPH